MLQVQVNLKMRQPKCGARVEVRPAPDWARKMILESAARLYDRQDVEAPAILAQVKEVGLESLFSWAYVVWEKADGEVELADGFTKELLMLALDVIQNAYQPEGSLAAVMVRFYDRWGPIFKDEAMPEVVAHDKLALLAWSALCWGYRQKDMDFDILDRVLIKPLQEAQELQAAQGKNPPASWELAHPGEFFFMPREDGAGRKGYRIILPRETPDWKRRDKVIAWVKKVVLANVKQVLAGVEYRTFADSRGNLRLIAQPRDAYGLALLRIIWGDGNRLRKCACGCGLHTFNKWYHPSHQRRGQIKQNELSYWRLQKDRGKLSEGQYELIKAEINHLWSAGPRGKDELRALIEKKFPRP